MWTDLAAVCDRFSQLAFMAVIIFGSHAIARRTQDRRVREEARRIRGALGVSLQALGELYRDNLRLLASGSRQLLSGRNQVQVLRIQLGRVVALLEGEIEAVLAANIALEAAETAMAIAGKPLGGVAFILPDDSGAAEAVKQPLLHVCAMLEAAQALLARLPSNLPGAVCQRARGVAPCDGQTDRGSCLERAESRRLSGAPVPSGVPFHSH